MKSSSIFAVAFVSLVACSGPAEPGGQPESGAPAAGCTVTLSGAVTATKPCIVAATADAKGAHFGLSTTDAAFSFASDLSASSLATGTYPLSATTKTASAIAQGTAVWAEYYGDGQHPNQGDATFTIDDVGQQVTGSNGVAWTGEHGSLTATLTPADQFASGTVTVTATF